MAQAGHVGKIVLALGTSRCDSIREIVANGTVLVTGGLGALGSATARWLAGQGAKSLVLASRDAKDGDPVALELRKSGVDVSVERVDVASGAQIAQLLRTIRSERPPLTAIFHAAGVLEDAVLGREDWSNYTKSTAAKLQGAWNLHRLTLSDPVKLMVLFSSAASTLGSAGQGSYAASNAFLDALAHFRRARGMDTLSVNWGAWASGGMAARLSAEHRARWERQGIRVMENAAALSALESAITNHRAQVAIMDLDWQQFLSNRGSCDAALFRELSRREKTESSAAAAEDRILQKILSASTADREQLLSLHIKECARQVLSLDPGATIHDRVPLQDIGLDSLMALEMRNGLAQSLALTLSAGLLFNYPTVQELTDHLLALLPVTDESPAKTAVGKNEDLAALDAMSDEEAELLLLEELDGSGRKAHV
jgi:NAD(P)-dependent dehydrogenase (short-subunit alcohol dehydrogenase family)/acyl carrier protein